MTDTALLSRFREDRRAVKAVAKQLGESIAYGKWPLVAEAMNALYAILRRGDDVAGPVAKEKAVEVSADED